MTKRKSCFIVGAALMILFLVILVLTKTFDVKAIGPMGTSVGFATINGAFHRLTGTNDTLYNISQILAYLSLAVGLGFGLKGAYQLITRRGFFKVDSNLLTMGYLYVFVIFLYILFDKVAINYRPIIEAGMTYPEPSFPSSHTLLVITIFGSAFVYLGYILKNRRLLTLVRVLSVVIIVLMIVCRLLSGVHWLTDIFASIFLGVSLIFIYAGAIIPPKGRHARR